MANQSDIEAINAAKILRDYCKKSKCGSECVFGKDNICCPLLNEPKTYRIPIIQNN